MSIDASIDTPCPNIVREEEFAATLATIGKPGANFDAAGGVTLFGNSGHLD